MLNRGLQPDPFGDRIERLQADRTTSDFGRVLRGRTFDAVVDFAAYSAEDARGAVDALAGNVDHYIFISSGQVYLVRDDYRPPSRESDYAGAVLPRPHAETPEGEYPLNQWLYGMGKREAEDVLMAAWQDRAFPATILRLPMVNGERDNSGRLEAYLWRILDGGPVLLPSGGEAIARHVYSGSVVHLIADILGRESTVGQAYNLSQEETPTVRELVETLAISLGAQPRPRAVSPDALLQAGLDPVDVSPFSTPWMSCVDPSRAREELNFRHVPLREYLDRIVASFLAHPPAAPPPEYATRERELQLASELGNTYSL